MSKERGNNFWFEGELRVGTCESRWTKEIIDSGNTEKFFGGDEMNATVERDIGYHLLLAGPMVDGFLKEIGKIFPSKLAKGKMRGLAPTASMFIPWGIMKNIINLMKAYSCACIMVQADSSKKK